MSAFLVFGFGLGHYTARPAGGEEGKVYAERVECKFVANYDGDTITVNIPGWPAIVGDNVSVRIFGIDTPERRGKTKQEKQMAIRAQQVVFKMLGEAKTVELVNVRQDKYFRLLAEVYADGVSVANRLLSEGLARPYDGGKKQPWGE